MFRSSTQHLFVFASCLLAVSIAGCSSFGSDWKKAATQPLTGQDLLGRWQGKWVSEVNGHDGDLRCIVTPMEYGRYRAQYHASFWNVLTFEQVVPLTVGDEREGRLYFTGEADLGWLCGGVYQYEGHLDKTRFYSTYRSKNDHGYYEMIRVREDHSP